MNQMNPRMFHMNAVDAGDLSAEINAEIDAEIASLLRENAQEGMRLESLALECSAALLSADAMEKSLSEQGLFRRFWNQVTGTNAKLRDMVDRNQTVAMYAMQETVNSILQESQRNTELALCIKEKMERELLRLEENQLAQEQSVNEIRTAIVRVWKNFEGYARRLEAREAQLDSRCEYCREKIRSEQIVCPVCGTIQGFKMNPLPSKIQEQILHLSEVVAAKPEEWAADVLWCRVVRDYAGRMRMARDIAQSCGLLDEYNPLKKDMDELIERCRAPEFQIAVAGVVKAGKSMLLNALIGMELAYVDVNSATAALAKFRSSPNGHYVKVRFYSKEEWEKLRKSAEESEKESPNSKKKRTYEKADTTFRDALKSPEVKALSREWVGHPQIVERFGRSDIQSFRKSIQRWTAADSNEHLFVAEAEVGVDYRDFNMPPEVVFVDTPGLSDVIRYRSEITKKYIHRADAVLLAIKPDTPSEEAYGTLGKVQDIVRRLDRFDEESGDEAQDKFLIVFTQKDLKTQTEYEKSEDAWVRQLVRRGRYASDRAARRHIFGVSASLHLCMQKVLSLDERTLEEVMDSEGRDSEAISYEECANLEAWIRKKLGRRGRNYDLCGLPADKKTLEEISEYFGIERLKTSLNERLIANHRKKIVETIATLYWNCAERLNALFSNAVTERDRIIQSAQSGEVAIREELNKVKDDMEQLDAGAENLRQTLEALQRHTKELIQKI